MNKKQTLGIMGGTFDPIHIGHTDMSLFCKEKYNFDKFLFIPTGDPPHKKLQSGNKHHRLNMTQLAVNDIDFAEVSDMEICREKTTYTYDTLIALRAEYPDWEFFYIIGADTLADLHTWYRFADVVKLTNFLVVDREADNNLNVVDLMDNYRKNYNASIINTSYKGLNISSTEIRKRIKRNESISGMVDKAVEGYIYSNELYK